MTDEQPIMLFDKIQEYLDSFELAYTVEPEVGRIQVPMTSHKGSWTTYILVSEEDDRPVRVYSVLPLRVFPERHADMFAFFNHLNSEQVVGNWSLNVESNEAMLKTALFVADGELEPRMFDTIFATNIHDTTDALLPATLLAVGAMTLADAIKLVAQSEEMEADSVAH